MSTRHRRPWAISANPMLVGATALLILVAAVYVSVTAGRGLPFVPTYKLAVQLPDAAQLARGADVTIAGSRVGQVSSLRAVRGASGRPVTLTEIAIDPVQGPLPVDSRFRVRLSGSLGRKALAITPGPSRRTFSDGATVPLANAARDVVDADQVLGAFTPPARAGAGQLLAAFGPGFAGRGAGLGEAIGVLPALLADLEPVMRLLADDDTGLERLVRGLAATSGQLASVAGPLAELQTRGADTFTALASVAPELRETLSETPATLTTSGDALRRSRPFLRSSAALVADLEDAATRLPRSAPRLADALAAGAENLPAVPALSDRLVVATEAQAAFAELPVVRPGFQRLTRTAGALGAPLAFLRPAETTCRYASLLTRNLASLVSEGYATGKSVRVSGIVVAGGAQSERGPSSTVSRNAVAKAIGPLHSNPYPNTAAPGQPRECEAGDEPYVTDRPVVGNVPGLQRATTESPDLP